MTFYEFLPWLTGLHVAAVLVFAGGLVGETVILAALPQNQNLSLEQQKLAAFVHRLDRRLTAPALLLVWILGITLAVTMGWFSETWLQVKLVFVLILSALHGMQSGLLRRLANGSGPVRGQTLRLTIILAAFVLVAILAVVKPF